jgi:hypothetical protein
MPCSICRQAGHNRSTCGQRVNPGINLQRVQQVQSLDQQRRALREALASDRVMTTNIIHHVRPVTLPLFRRNLWKRAIQGIIDDIRFVKIAKGNSDSSSYRIIADVRVYYPSWLKVKDRFIFQNPMNLAQSIYIRDLPRAIQLVGNIQCIKNACLILYTQRNPIRVDTPKTELGTIKLVNLRDENYLVYWVVGNYMVQELDDRENDIRYMGLCVKGSSFPLRTMIGHRFYLVPHRLNTEPPYHPQTDKQFFIEPYLQLNIHDKTGDTVYIDDKDKLSELNKWKFNALKLDFLIREVIKLGGKNNDVLESVLDLHEDIKLSDTGEWFKDIAGIPSTFTNIT